MDYGNSVGSLINELHKTTQKNEIIKIMNFGYDDKFVEHGTPEELEKQNGLDAQSIAKHIQKNLE